MGEPHRAAGHICSAHFSFSTRVQNPLWIQIAASSSKSPCSGVAMRDSVASVSGKGESIDGIKTGSNDETEGRVCFGKKEACRASGFCGSGQAVWSGRFRADSAKEVGCHCHA
jgi:hypothetical protein